MSGRKTYINPYAKGNYIGMSTSQLGGSGSSNTATDGDGAAAAATLSTNRRTTRSSPKKNTTNDTLTSCAGKSDDYNDVLLSGLTCNLLIQTINENKGMREEIKCMRVHH